MGTMQIYAPLISEGNLEIRPKKNGQIRDDIFMVEDEFYVAITHSSIEEIVENMPLMVAYIPKSHWKVHHN